MKKNQDYKNAALAALKGKWAPAVIAAVIYFLIAGGVSFTIELFGLDSSAEPSVEVTKTVLTLTFVSLLVSFFVTMPLGVGYYNAHNQVLVNDDDRILANSFRIGFANYGHNVWGMFLMGLFIFLWMLLLVIPGIVKSFSYALTPYILAEKPELSGNEAINLSRKMMKGHKFDMFWLSLSFIGWGLLCILTLGIGFLWLTPYMYTSYAAFYQDVKADYEAKTNSINN